MIQKVGDRDKSAYSIKPYAFALLANDQSKCQKVIEIEDENGQDNNCRELYATEGQVEEAPERNGI